MKRDTFILGATVALVLCGCGDENSNTPQQMGTDTMQQGQVIQEAIAAAPVATISNEQKYTLAYMWNEERLAHDLYLALNELYATQTLSNIATKGEAQHVSSVELLIEKYDLNIFNLDDYSGGYSAEALEAYSAGSYSIDGIAQLYSDLYALGSTSQIDALKVGCMVEVTDIDDLNADLQTVAGLSDFEQVFTALRDGSYSHYWAFDTALKNSGVSDGCCSISQEYCKTELEYPRPQKGNGH